MMFSLGKIPRCVKVFTLSLCISYWSSLPVRQSSDYQLMNKGDEVKPNLRSRYVGREFNDGKMEGLSWLRAAVSPHSRLKEHDAF